MTTRIYSLTLRNGEYSMGDSTYITTSGDATQAIKQLQRMYMDRYVLAGFPCEHHGYNISQSIHELIEQGGMVLSRFHHESHMWNGTYLVVEQ